MDVIFDELLYFIVNKMKTSASNKIVDICTKFYSADEVAESKDKLWEKIQKLPSLANSRKVGRMGDKKTENNLDDMIKWIKAIDDSGDVLPRCASLDMTRIPLSDDGSLTTSQIMAHHDSLRKEFVTIDSLQLCLNNLKTDILSTLKPCASTETVQS